MAEPFIGEIRMAGFSFAPQNWASCNGQILNISQNTALFSLIGTTYGGDGVRTFALPNLQGRIPIHVGNGHPLGQQGGEESHTLTTGEMPPHIHPLNATSAPATANDPTGNLLAQASGTLSNVYGPFAQAVNMAGNAVSNAGGGQSHENRQPFLVINFIIALTGIFPNGGAQEVFRGRPIYR